MQDISCIIVTMNVLTNAIHLSESTVVICFSKITWLAQNLTGVYFSRLVIFCVLLELIFESQMGFSCCELIFAILNKLQTNHIFMFIEYVEWIIHIFKQYYGVRTLCKTSKPGYFSLSFDYNICSDWLFLWSIRSDLIISWCIMSPTKHSEFNLK